MKTNSQFPIVSWLYMADIDGDGIDEFLQINGTFLSAFKPDFELRPVTGLQLDAPIQRLVAGSFNAGDAREQVGLLLTDGSIRFFGLSPDRTALWWWMTMPAFIEADEQYIVGDYDGDGADEILVFHPGDGRLRMYQIGPSGFFEQMGNFQPGNLSGLDLRGKQILAGAFNDSRVRKDLLVIDPHNRQLFLYGSVTLEDGTVTFWWSFTTIAYLYQPGAQIYAANLDGLYKDGILIRQTDGIFHLFHAVYNNGRLSPHPLVLPGQIPVQANTARFVIAKVRDLAFRRERRGRRRDDILFFDEDSRQLTRTDARYDGNNQQLTYWWAFTSDRIFIGSNHSFDTRINAGQVLILLERHRFAYFQIFGCNNLSDTEKNRLAATYRDKAIRHGIDTNPLNNASAAIGGDWINVNFMNLFLQSLNEIGQTLIHEMMHVAGYTHPARQISDVPFDGGAYYSSSPLRAEICIVGFQSDGLRSIKPKSKKEEKQLLWLEHSHCNPVGDGAFNHETFRPFKEVKKLISEKIEDRAQAMKTNPVLP